MYLGLQEIEVWFTDQNSHPLEIEDTINLTLVINDSIIKMRYSIEPTDRIYVKGYGFLSFTKTMNKNFSIEYSQKLLNSAKKPTTKATKTASKRGLQKTAEATGDLIGDKITDKITDDSKMSLMELQSTELHSKGDPGNNAIEVPTKRVHISRRKAANY